MAETERRYSDREVSAIIARAMELQKQQRADPEQPASHRDGLTLREIEGIAHEVGIDPLVVSRAAFDVRSPNPSEGWTGFLGAKPEAAEVVRLDREAEEEEMKELLVALPSITGETGVGNAFRGRLSWTTTGDRREETGRRLMIEAVETSDGGEVRITEKLGGLAGGMFGGLIGGVGLGAGFGVGFGVGLGVLGSALFAALFPIGAIAISYIAARLGFKALVRWRRRAVREMADRIGDFLARPRRDRRDELPPPETT